LENTNPDRVSVPILIMSRIMNLIREGENSEAINTFVSLYTLLNVDDLRNEFFSQWEEK
jgi:hypothetical protein